MDKTSFLRYTGNTLLVIGHFMLLWGPIESALTVKIIGGLLIFPFAISYKLWDVVALEFLFGSMDVSKLYQVLFS